MLDDATSTGGSPVLTLKLPGMGQAGSLKSKVCSEKGKFLAAKSAAGKKRDLMISV